MGPSDRDLTGARDKFRSLLDAETKEADWQSFFAEHPYVLSMSLPLRIEPADILALGRPGRTEPDFIFYPRHTIPVPYYGVIELKKPSSKIVTVTRKNVAIMSRDAETAIQQAISYSDEISQHAPALAEAPTVFLGNRAHIFVVMGMSREISDGLATDVYREMITKRLPPNLQVLPFDTLLASFESKIQHPIYILTPSSTFSISQVHDMVEGTKLYVGNLSYTLTNDDLRAAFANAGTVRSAFIIMDKMTNRSKGFAFLEMSSPRDVHVAIEMWNDRVLDGRRLTVNEARPMEPRAPRTLIDGGYGNDRGGDRGGRSW